jgi:hypothetical protein
MVSQGQYAAGDAKADQFAIHGATDADCIGSQFKAGLKVDQPAKAIGNADDDRPGTIPVHACHGANQAATTAV